MLEADLAANRLSPILTYFDSKGVWLTYVILLFLGHLVVLSIPHVSVGMLFIFSSFSFKFQSTIYFLGTSWTLTNVLHNAIMWMLLHWEKGAPHELLDQGKARRLTQWEQLGGRSGRTPGHWTPTKKFLFIVPCVLFILASFYSMFSPIHFVINTAALIILGILPKLPALHRFRLFGINKY